MKEFSEYKYILMSKMESESKFSREYSFTFDHEGVLKENQEIWPNREYKVILNPNRNI